jgi:hypothetical protein
MTIKSDGSGMRSWDPAEDSDDCQREVIAIYVDVEQSVSDGKRSTSH